MKSRKKKWTNEGQAKRHGNTRWHTLAFSMIELGCSAGNFLFTYQFSTVVALFFFSICRLLAVEPVSQRSLANSLPSVQCAPTGVRNLRRTADTWSFRQPLGLSTFFNDPPQCIGLSCGDGIAGSAEGV